MASLYQRGRKWWIKAKVNGRVVREPTGTADHGKAEVLLEKFIGDAAKKRFAAKMGVAIPIESKDTKLTLSAFLERYQGHYVNAGGPDFLESRTRSWKTEVSQLSSLVDYFERKGLGRVAAVEGAHVEAYRDWRLAHGDVSGATVNRAIRVGKAAWSWAVRAGIARSNPFKGVKPIKLAQYEPRNLTDVEIRKVLDVARREFPAFFPMVALGLYAGLRIGEILALDWSDFDWGEGRGAQAGGTIRVRCDETFHTKSRKPRTVPLAAELRAILDPLRAPAGLCFPSPKPDPDGKPRRYYPTAVTHAFERIAAAAKVDFTAHDLRRTFAGILANRLGVPPTRIRDYLGHASLSTTETYYVGRGEVDHADVARLSFGARNTGECSARVNPLQRRELRRARVGGHAR